MCKKKVLVNLPTSTLAVFSLSIRSLWPRPIQSISRDVRLFLSPPGNHASRWTGDLWWKSMVLIFVNIYEGLNDFL